jgi:protein SSD1
MTDEPTPQPKQAPKKDEKKPVPSAGRTAKKNASGQRPSTGGQGGPRPSSRTNNKKTSTPSVNAAESGSDTTSRKGSEKKPDQRNKNQGGSGAGGGGGGSIGRSGMRKGLTGGTSSGRQGNNAKEQVSHKQSASPAPAPNAEASAALSSLQRVIADLKTAPPAPPAPANNAPPPPPQVYSSNLPTNAPVFQPGAAAYPGIGLADPKHRKAASLGQPMLSGNFNSFSPHLGAMIEDAEDGHGNTSVEDGEIQETFFQPSGHQPRSQSQSFVAPRFAALAQQDQVEAIGPTGRPQLAPGFMFGARRRATSNVPMGPPINEEDVGFQFPQQQQQQHQQPQQPQQQQPQPTFQPEHVAPETMHRKTDSGEFTGIMAEQVL